MRGENDCGDCVIEHFKCLNIGSTEYSIYFYCMKENSRKVNVRTTGNAVCLLKVSGHCNGELRPIFVVTREKYTRVCIIIAIKIKNNFF